MASGDLCHVPCNECFALAAPFRRQLCRRTGALVSRQKASRASCHLRDFALTCEILIARDRRERKETRAHEASPKIARASSKALRIAASTVEPFPSQTPLECHMRAEKYPWALVQRWNLRIPRFVRWTFNSERVVRLVMAEDAVIGVPSPSLDTRATFLDQSSRNRRGSSAVNLFIFSQRD